MKKVLYVLVGLVVLICVLGFIAPKDFAVEMEIVINKPKDQVFEYIKYLKNQQNYGTWAKKDPDIKQEFHGTDGTAGFIVSWEGNKEVGKGEQEIKKITVGDRIDFELRFKVPWESTMPAYMITENAGDNQTKVKWGFSGTMPFPMNIMLLFMNTDNMGGKDFAEGLSNLKGILEQ